MEYNVYLTLTPITEKFDFYLAFKITLPAINDDAKFDKVYLGINAISELYDGSTELTYTSQFMVFYKSFYNRLKKPIEYDDISYQNQVVIESLPDNYYNDYPDQSNKKFYVIDKAPTHLSGYKLFDLEINSVSEYQDIHELLIIFRRKADDAGLASYVDDHIKFAELAVIFENGISLSEEVFA